MSIYGWKRAVRRVFLESSRALSVYLRPSWAIVPNPPQRHCHKVLRSACGVATYRGCPLKQEQFWSAIRVTCGVFVGILSATGTYWVLDPDKVSLNQINDHVFNTTDNIFVFQFEREEELQVEWAKMRRVIDIIMHEGGCRPNFYFNVRSTAKPLNDSFEPDGSLDQLQEVVDSQRDSEATMEEHLVNPSSLKCMMYKGQRKDIIAIEEKIPVDRIVEFFRSVSTPVNEAATNFVVPQVSRETFWNEVVLASSSSRPVLVQMFEESCFLCFLMRPFVNSMAKLFQDYGVPMSIKRLDIERNDFPAGCPVSRSTPTFILFRGLTTAPEKWEEFRPKEILKKLHNDFSHMVYPEVLAKLEQFQEIVFQRFQLFGQLITVIVEAHKLTRNISQANASAPPTTTVEVAEENAEELSGFIVEVMSQDLQRFDFIPENIQLLQRQVAEAEEDVRLLRNMFGHLVLPENLSE